MIVEAYGNRKSKNYTIFVKVSPIHVIDSHVFVHGWIFAKFLRVSNRLNLKLVSDVPSTNVYNWMYSYYKIQLSNRLFSK